MRRTLWSIAIAGLALGSLVMVGGTTLGGDLRPLAVGYGTLMALAAIYLAAGLVIRDRAWRRLRASRDTSSTVQNVAARRVF